MKKNKMKTREQRKKRIKARIKESGNLVRIAVFKSRNHIYGQVIDDRKGETVASQNDINISKKELAEEKSKLKGKERIAFITGKMIAKKIKEKNIEKLVFDRGGFRYHGRIKAFAEGVREGGVKI